MNIRQFGNSLKRRFVKSQRGQAAVVIIVTASTMMALAAASVETGHVYYAYQRLVASTNAAVLAGAAQMPNTTSASTYVTKYSSASGGYNATAMLPNAVATPTYLCLSTVSNTLNVPCTTSSGGTAVITRFGDADLDDPALVWRVGRDEADDSFLYGGSGDGGRVKRALEHCHHSGHHVVDERFG